MLKQNIFKQLVCYLLAAAVIISSAGFVSVTHLCTSASMQEKIYTCQCGSDCAEQPAKNNSVSTADCCIEKTDYFINAIASFDVKKEHTDKSIFASLIYPATITHLFVSLPSVNISTTQKPPPQYKGKELILLHRLLLI